jgi:hypothetical protein
MTEDKTYYEYAGEGHYVRIQHCEGCGAYLGVEYPTSFCADCTPSPIYLASQYLWDKERGIKCSK